MHKLNKVGCKYGGPVEKHQKYDLSSYNALHACDAARHLHYYKAVKYITFYFIYSFFSKRYLDSPRVLTFCSVQKETYRSLFCSLLCCILQRSVYETNFIGH